MGMFDTIRRFFFGRRCTCGTSEPSEQLLIFRLLTQFNLKLDTIMSTNIQLTDKLNAVSARLDKISAESTKTIKAVEELKAVIAAQDKVSAELEAAVDKVDTQTKTLDDLTPDLPEDDTPKAPLMSPGPSGASNAGTGTSETSTSPETPAGTPDPTVGSNANPAANP